MTLNWDQKLDLCYSPRFRVKTRQFMVGRTENRIRYHKSSTIREEMIIPVPRQRLVDLASSLRFQVSRIPVNPSSFKDSSSRMF